MSRSPATREAENGKVCCSKRERRHAALANDRIRGVERMGTQGEDVDMAYRKSKSPSCVSVKVGTANALSSELISERDHGISVGTNVGSEDSTTQWATRVFP